MMGGAVVTEKFGREKASVRDAKKARTANILREAALELFVAQGYDATTTEQVAERAGVSVRTFFRYFETKDEVMFKGQLSWSDSFAEVYCGQPKSMNPLEAMCATLIQLGAGLGRRPLQRYDKIVESSIALRGRASLRQRENVERLAAAMAARQGLAEPDEACRLMGSVCGLMHRLAVEEWRDGSGEIALSDVIVAKFRLLGEVCEMPIVEPALRRSVGK